MNITVFGTGYVGLVTGAALAELGHKVLCIDIDQEKISKMQQGMMPFYEPGMEDLVKRNTQKNRLDFSTNQEEGIAFGEVIFTCVGTPMQEEGSADLQYVLAVTEAVAKHAKRHKLLINKSTVPPGTAVKCAEILKQHNSPVEIVSNPEFLKQGNAIYDCMHPDKIVVGAKSEEAFAIMRRVYHGLVKTYVPFLEMDWQTAEMIKYANNSFLATKISFINEIANICTVTGADVHLVAKAIGMDYRISPKFLNAGIGYGGSCFPKDVTALVHTAASGGYQAELLQQVHETNERQKTMLVPQIISALQQVDGKQVTLWGVSFKPKTSDLRGAPGVEIIKELLDAGYNIVVYDPIALEETKRLFGDKILYSSSIENSVVNSDAIVLVTEWDEFRNVDFGKIAQQMSNKLLFDGRNIYEPEMLREEKFTYCGVGRGCVH
jgi:UDPglucose 6-dehydrogenase